MAKSFTAQSAKCLRVIRTKVHVGPAFDPSKTDPSELKEYVAIWDTGATGTVITERVVAECGLKQIGVVKCHGADGEYLTEVYPVSVGLPNHVGFPFLTVTRGKLMAGSDLLIGMDIISQGDFAITNHEGKTCFSFRLPSCETIDFIKKPAKPPPPVHSEKVGRNELCPCGSGKRYKRCCGK